MDSLFLVKLGKCIYADGDALLSWESQDMYLNFVCVQLNS